MGTDTNGDAMTITIEELRSLTQRGGQMQRQALSDHAEAEKACGAYYWEHGDVPDAMIEQRDALGAVADTLDTLLAAAADMTFKLDSLNATKEPTK